MYKVAKGHYFISRGVKFGPGDAITEKEFASKEVFLKRVEAGHIVASAEKDSGAKTDSDSTKEKSEALKAAKENKKSAAKAVKETEKVLAAEKEELEKADELQKHSLEQSVNKLEAALAESKNALEKADAELAALEEAH